MLENVDLKYTVNKNEYSEKSDLLKEELTLLQQEVIKAKLPVIIIIEGWGASGKGRIIGKVIKNFDPRGFKVYSTVEATPLELRRPFLHRFWANIPEAGNFSIYDRSWYQDISVFAKEADISSDVIKHRTSEIKTFEKQLTDDGYLIIKLFLHIDKKEQKKRFSELEKDEHTSWRVTRKDKKHNENYDKYYELFDDMMEKTNFSFAPWKIVPCNDKKTANLSVYEILVSSIKEALAKKENRKALTTSDTEISPSKKFQLIPIPKLNEIDLNKKIELDEYSKELKALQSQLNNLHNQLYVRKIPVVMCYEGWDAAGKGGNIKRIASALDPRGYDVIPVAAPTKPELMRHYLWRVWNNMPKTGHIAIFDRTWYGRVMVERIEGFCTSDEWHRAFEEMNEFEKTISDWGAIILKFWIHIDKDEQLKRFQDRQNTPEKQYKITDEDWRNREKWNQYENAIDDMLKYTCTDFAPWHIIESQDKRYARIKALKIMIETLKGHLD